VCFLSSERLDFLIRCPLFQYTPHKVLREISLVGLYRKYSLNQVILQQARLCCSDFIIHQVIVPMF
jgi:hypothetical protein